MLQLSTLPNKSQILPWTNKIINPLHGISKYKFSPSPTRAIKTFPDIFMQTALNSKFIKCSSITCKKQYLIHKFPETLKVDPSDECSSFSWEFGLVRWKKNKCHSLILLFWGRKAAWSCWRTFNHLILNICSLIAQSCTCGQQIYFKFDFHKLHQQLKEQFYCVIYIFAFYWGWSLQDCWNGHATDNRIDCLIWIWIESSEEFFGGQVENFLEDWFRIRFLCPFPSWMNCSWTIEQ